jgi:type IV pilus assembly protein PilA
MTAQTHKNKKVTILNKKVTTLSLSKGFTLIELLVVIGILAILLAITLIAINPSRQFAQANNTKRSSDVNAILNAIGQFQADNNGRLPGGTVITGTAQVVSPVTDADFGTFCTDLVPTYIAALPTDPASTVTIDEDGISVTECAGLAWSVLYTVSVTNGRVTVAAPNTEIPPATAAFTVTR